nr:vegetative incompatibility protein het-e-1 [Quercus suber]
MRLLNVHTLTFDEFHHPNVPPYVVASHRWVRGHEITLQDMMKHTNTEKTGYQKVEGFVRYMTATLPHIEWLWIDTCCINQDSSREVSEAVNSMFRWYRRSAVCLTYLHDVDCTDDASALAKSEWFKRGWTLQELLAPDEVIFLGRNWQVLGHKSGDARNTRELQSQKGPLLTRTIASVTGIPENVLRDYTQGSGLSIEQKMTWTQGRLTTVEEDMSYCLLGIFDVSMSIIYGEGKEKALKRLRNEIGSNGQDSASRYVHATPLGIDVPALQQVSKLRCSTCLKLFETLSALDQHRRDVHAPAPVVTGQNGRTGRTALAQTLLDSPAHARRYDCQLCTKPFTTQTALDQHLSAAPGHEKPFLCSQCGKPFSTRVALEQHVQGSPGHSRPFDCDHCGRPFDGADAHNQHVCNTPIESPPESKQSMRSVLKSLFRWPTWCSTCFR